MQPILHHRGSGKVLVDGQSLGGREQLPPAARRRGDAPCQRRTARHQEQPHVPRPAPARDRLEGMCVSQRLALCVEDMAESRAGNRRKRGDPPLEARGGHELPPLDAAPVMSHEVNPLARRERVTDSREVRRKQLEPVRGRTARSARRAGAPDVVGDDMELGGKKLDHRQPDVLGVRVAVHEHDRRPRALARLEHRQGHRVARDGPMLSAFDHRRGNLYARFSDGPRITSEAPRDAGP